jgi:menaquinone-dependent protoporphyrinogen oxidase
MTRILVIFGTTDGHTRKVAQSVAATFRAGEGNVECDVIQAGHADIIPHYYSAVVVCASVHGGRYQRPIARWVRRNAETLNLKPTTFISVCLGVLQKDPTVQQHLDAIARRFLTKSGWQPTQVKIVAGALLYRRYGWLKRAIMKRIVAQAGGDSDTSPDYEYTDWEDLRAFAEHFIRIVAAQKLTTTSAAYREEAL